MFYYHMGNQTKQTVLLPQGHPTKQMFYYHKGTQLNQCITTSKAPN